MLPWYEQGHLSLQASCPPLGLSYGKNVKIFGASMPNPYLAATFRPKRDRRAELLF
jgi:hypothetical protein